MDHKQDGMAIPQILGKHCKARGVLIDLETTKYLNSNK